MIKRKKITRSITFIFFISVFLGFSNIQSEISKLQTKLGDLKNSLTGLQTNLNNLSTKLGTLKTKLITLKTQTSKPEKEISLTIDKSLTYEEIIKKITNDNFIEISPDVKPGDDYLGEKNYLLTQESIQQLPDNTLKKLFPQLTKDSDNIKKVRSFINKFTKNKEWHKYKKLRVCCCGNFEIVERILITLMQVNDIKKKYPDTKTKIVHTSLGTGDLLQAYFLVDALINFGYKDIIINAIDSLIETNENDSSNFKKNFTKLIKKEHPNVNVKVNYYNNANEYIDQINKNNNLRSHSFDLIDIGGVLGNLELLIHDSKILLYTEYEDKDKKFEELSVFKKENLTLDKYSYNHIEIYTKESFKIAIFLDYNENKTLTKLAKKKLDKNFLIKELKINDCNTIEEILNKIKSIDSIETKEPSGEWFQKKSNLEKKYYFFHIKVFANAYLDLKKLINRASVENPVIYEGINNKIKKYLTKDIEMPTKSHSGTPIQSFS